MTHIWWAFGLLLVINHSIGYPRGVKNFERNPEELGGFFEGDMDLSDEQFLELRSRNGYISKTRRWPNKLVYYKISPDFGK